MLPDAVEIRPFVSADAQAVTTLLREVFDEHVAPTFEPEGVVEIHRSFAPLALIERAQTQAIFVAWHGALVVGVIAVRETDHISLLFVRTSHMGLGIATALVARMVDACRAAGRSRVTVNSALNARTFYERLGFEATAGPQYIRGLAYVPMTRWL